MQSRLKGGGGCGGREEVLAGKESVRDIITEAWM